MRSRHQVTVTLALVVLLSLRHHVSCQENYVIVPGDVMLAAMLSVTHMENGVCGTYNAESLQSIVAVQWFLEGLNRRDYIPGVTLGLDVYRTCRMPEKATEGAIRLMTKYGVVQDDVTHNNQSVLFGLLGPESTSGALAVSSLVSSLPVRQHLLQLSGSSTGQQLSDATRYPNFFRVIPPDDTQVRVMLALLLQLQWNYVAIVYEDDHYGRSAATELRRLAQEEQVCVPVFSSLPIDIKSSQFAIKAKQIALELKSPQNGLVRGVVILGGTTTTRDLLETLSRYVSYVTLVLSEAVALQRTTLLTASGQVSQLAGGAMVTTPPYLPIPEVQAAWNNLWSNRSAFESHARVNPWMARYFEQIAGCSYLTSGCWEQASVSRTNQMAVEGRELSLYISYQVKATAVMAALLKQLYQSTCGAGGSGSGSQPSTPGSGGGGSSSGLCQQLRDKVGQRSEVLALLRQSRLDLSTFSFLSPAFSAMTAVHFNSSTGDPVMPPSEEDYTVHNFRRPSSSSSSGGDFNFVKIGLWRENTLTVNTSLAQFYDESRNPLTWSQLLPAQCPNNHDCVMCDRDVSQEVMVVKGHFYVVGVAPVSEEDAADPLKCGPVKALVGADVAQSLLFAVEQVNKKTGIFANVLPGRKVGLIVINSCGSASLVRQRLMDISAGKIPEASSLGQHQNGSRSVVGQVMGYVGPYYSSNSMAAGDTLKDLGHTFVQISGASTSSALSDTTRFPYFLRLPAPDDKQTVALLDIVQSLGANYIQVLYDGSKPYARGLFQNLESTIKDSQNKYNICIAQSIASRHHDDFTEYRWIKNQLRQKPEARIVIIILHHLEITKVLKAILPSLNPQEFLFIATESWGRRQDFLTIADSLKLAGSLVLSQEIVIDPFFQNYFQNLHPEASRNPWLAYFWEAKLRCYFSKSFRRQGKPTPCPANFARGNTQEVRIPFHIQSVYALVLGFSRALSRLCGSEAETICQDLTSEALFQEMLKVRLDLYGRGQVDLLFDSKGDGLVGYKVLQIERDDTAATSDVLRYVDVGSWSRNKLALGVERLTLAQKPGFVSHCPTSVECKACFSSTPSPLTEPCETDQILKAAFVSVVVVLLLIIVALGIVLVLLRRRQKTSTTAKRQMTSTQMKELEFYSHHTNDSAFEPETGYSSIEAAATQPPMPPPAPCRTSTVSDGYLHACHSSTNSTV